MAEFNFLDQFRPIIEEASKVAEAAPKVADVSDIYSAIFKDQKSIKIMIASGLSWSEFKIEKANPERKSLGAFSRMKPIFKSKDQFDREKVEAYFAFRCCVAGICAQNKGKIYTVDLACLYIGLCRKYKVASSVRALVVKIANDLKTTAESVNDVITIDVCGDAFRGYVKDANIVISAVKSAANTGDL